MKLDGNEYDISAYSSEGGADATDPQALVHIALVSGSNVDATCYIDDFIFTQNED